MTTVTESYLLLKSVVQLGEMEVILCQAVQTNLEELDGY